MELSLETLAGGPSGVSLMNAASGGNQIEGSLDTCNVISNHAPENIRPRITTIWQ
jgi:hypothetical protein